MRIALTDLPVLMLRPSSLDKLRMRKLGMRKLTLRQAQGEEIGRARRQTGSNNPHPELVEG